MVAQGSFKGIVAVLAASSLAHGQAAKAPPTNQAFEAIPAGKVKFQTSPQGRETPRAILKNRIVNYQNA